MNQGIQSSSGRSSDLGKPILRANLPVPWLQRIVARKFRRLGLFVLVVLFGSASPALSQEATLTDDAYTSAKRAIKNFGADETVLVTATSEKGFLKFKLTPNLPAGTVGGHVGKATLKVFVGTVTAPGILTIYSVAAGWSEATITDSSAPAIGPVIATVNINADQIPGYVPTIDKRPLFRRRGFTSLLANVNTK